MTTTTYPAADVTHDLVLHDGAAELVDLMVPFVRDGTADGDLVVVMGGPEFVAALLAATPPAATLRALPVPPDDRVPARDLHQFVRLLGQLGRTASPVRVVNQMPAMTDAGWPAWRRYEAAVNVVLTPYRVWGKCGYDAGGLGPDMVGDLRASHSHVQTAEGRHPSGDFARLGQRVRAYLHVPARPIERAEPTLVLPGATPAEARHAVREIAVRSSLAPETQESVVLAANEAVTNAHLHGRPPVLLRVWVEPTGTMTVAVSDSGPGPHPLVGLVPGAADGSSAGGLWVVHLLLPDVHHRTSSDGYTITFAADGATSLPAAPGGHPHA